MTSNAGLGELVRELRATLEAISLGLVEGLPDRLLDAEPRLADIAARLASLPPSDIESLRPELERCGPIDRAQAALRRCERLGATVVSLGDVYATRHGYGRSGHFAHAHRRRRRRPAGEGLMSGLFGMLSTTARSLDAQRYGLDVGRPEHRQREHARLLAPRRRLRRGAADERAPERRQRRRGARRAPPPRSLLRSPAVPGEPGAEPRGGAGRGARHRRVEPRIARRHAERAAQPVLRRLQRARAGADVEHGARRRAGAGPGRWPARFAPPTAASSRRSSTPIAASARPSTRSTRSPTGWRRSTIASPTPTKAAR